MFTVTKENYRMFLTYHGQDIEVANYVVATYDNTDGYHSLLSVRLWVDASKMLVKMYGQD